MDKSDRDIVERVRSGDRGAVELMYRRHVGKVWRYARFRCGSREVAGDVVQETFLRAIKSIGQFEGRSGLGTWLHAIARSVAIDGERKRRRRGEVGEGNLRLILAEVEGDVVESREREAAVRQAVSSLVGGQRDAVVLFDLSGLSVRETAEALGWTEGRVRTTVHRARRRLRTMLSEYVEGGGGERMVGGK